MAEVMKEVFFSCYLFETEFLIEQGAHGLSRLSGQQAPGVPLTLSPQHWDNKDTPPHLAFYIDAGIKLKSSWLCDKHPTDRATYSSQSLSSFIVHT